MGGLNMTADKRDFTKLSRRQFGKLATLGATGLVASGVLPGINQDQVFSEGIKASGASAGKTSSWMTKPEPIDASLVAGTYEADIVIIGGGNAGTPAARAAAESGASVIVIERQAETGYSYFGNECGTVNSQFARSKGVEKIDPVEVLKDWQKRTINRTNPRLISQYVFNSGATFDWLINVLPKDFVDTITVFCFPKPKKYPGEYAGFRTWPGTAMFYGGKGYGWGDAMKLNVEKAKKLGAEYFYGNDAKEIIKENGAVKGVIALNGQGKYIKYVARKGVVIAAGDFSGNPEMCADLLSESRELFGDNMVKWSGMGRDGAGQRLGIWAGGRMEPGPHAQMNGLGAGAYGLLGAAPFVLQTNRNGERYTDESFIGMWGTCHQGIRQPRGLLATVWDAKWRQSIECQALEHGNLDTADAKKITDAEESMSKALAAGAQGYPPATAGGPGGRRMAGRITYGAKTLEELAGYLGYKGKTVDTFVVTVKRYNELCKKGYDEDFGKSTQAMIPIDNPPYYGCTDNSIGKMPGAMCTHAGLVIDEKQRVLDENDDPIPGLFASGNSSGGRFALQYSTPIGGCSIGLATTLGKIVGEYIAKL
jgi:fumarate reductase flavoprotein subunit